MVCHKTSIEAHPDLHVNLDDVPRPAPPKPLPKLTRKERRALIRKYLVPPIAA